MVFGGVALYAGGIWPLLSDFVQYVGMVITVGGLVLLLAGWRVARVAWVALALLVLAFPWPPSVYRGVSQSLQHVTAVASVWVLQLTGINADASGNRIAVYAAAGEVVTLNVAEACSGLRSLVTFVTLGIAVAVFARRPLWQKGVVVLATVPVAVLCNVMRVTAMGLLEVNGHGWVHEPRYHALTGLVMLIPGLGMIFGLLRVLDGLNPGAAAGSEAPAPRADARGDAADAVAPAGRGGRATFVAAVVVMVVAIAALDATVAAMRLQFVKRPVPLRGPLDSLPASLGHWRQVTSRGDPGDREAPPRLAGGLPRRPDGAAIGSPAMNHKARERGARSMSVGCPSRAAAW
jgi:exosortase